MQPKNLTGFIQWFLSWESQYGRKKGARKGVQNKDFCREKATRIKKSVAQTAAQLLQNHLPLKYGRGLSGRLPSQCWLCNSWLTEVFKIPTSERDKIIRLSLVIAIQQKRLHFGHTALFKPELTISSFGYLVAKSYLTPLWYHGLYTTRLLLCQWDFPAKSGLPFPSLWIFPIQGSNTSTALV